MHPESGCSYKNTKRRGVYVQQAKSPGGFSLADISKYDRLGAVFKHVICTQYGWGALCDLAIGLGFKLNAIDINTFLNSLERKLQGIPNVSNSFFEVPGGSMAPPERVADHLSLVIEQARLKPEAKRQKVDDTNLESSKTTERALVVLTSPVYQEQLSKTAKALAAPGGGITVATDLFARYSTTIPMGSTPHCFASPARPALWELGQHRRPTVTRST
jgi:hypothetical protein